MKNLKLNIIFVLLFVTALNTKLIGSNAIKRLDVAVTMLGHFNNMEEIWKDVPNYEGYYQVSNLGNVKSLSYNRSGKEKVFNPHTNANGYFYVNLCKYGKQKGRKIHQLVAEAFLGHIPNRYNGLIVDHINNIKTDNRVDNLQLTTARYNSSKDKKGCASKYTGVSYHKSSSKWMATIYIKGKRNYLGSFISEIAAGEAYKNALNQLTNVS
jgi:hypothetical protein